MFIVSPSVRSVSVIPAIWVSNAWSVVSMLFILLFMPLTLIVSIFMCLILVPLFLVPLCARLLICFGGWSGLNFLIRGSCLNLTNLLTFVLFFLVGLFVLLVYFLFCFWVCFWVCFLVCFFGYKWLVPSMPGVGDHLRSLPRLLSCWVSLYL